MTVWDLLDKSWRDYHSLQGSKETMFACLMECNCGRCMDIRKHMRNRQIEFDMKHCKKL